MPLELIKNYPINEWKIDLEKFGQSPILRAQNRINNGSLHIPPDFAVITVAPLYFESPIFYFPHCDDETLFSERSRVTFKGKLVKNFDELEYLRKSHGLQFLPTYFEFEIFEDTAFLSEHLKAKTHNLKLKPRKIFQKWQSMTVNSELILAS